MTGRGRIGQNYGTTSVDVGGEDVFDVGLETWLETWLETGLEIQNDDLESYDLAMLAKCFSAIVAESYNCYENSVNMDFWKSLRHSRFAESVHGETQWVVVVHRHGRTIC
jgi:hypothetical protein